MRNLSEMEVIHVEITNACHLRCANCTRHLGHHDKPFFMTLEQVENAIDSLEGFEGRIGLMGGAIHAPKDKGNTRDFGKKLKEDNVNYGPLDISEKNTVN